LTYLIHLQTTPQSQNTYTLDINTQLVVVYYNVEKPNMFMVDINVTLHGLKDQLNQINDHLNHRHNKGEQCWVSSFVNRLEQRENHVLYIWSA